MHVAFVGHVDVFQHGFGLFENVLLLGEAFKGVHAERPIALGEAGDHHVFQNRQIAENLGRLKHAGDAHLVDLVWLAAQHGLAVEHDRSGVGDQFADEAVQQGGFARTVWSDDGVNRVFRDGEVHVPKRLQAAEALVYAFDFKNSHLVSPYSAGVLAASLAASSSFSATEELAKTLSAFDEATGQEDHDKHEQDAQCQMPAFADERVDDEDEEVFEPVGQESEPLVQDLSLIFEKMFSKYLIKPAPRIGPISVPAPPRMVIRTTSPEAVHCMRSAPASGSIAAIRPPARPAYMPEMTKAASV